VAQGPTLRVVIVEDHEINFSHVLQSNASLPPDLFTPLA
jgi:hypothetical protein